jgi:hypothetical protein
MGNIVVAVGYFGAGDFSESDEELSTQVVN